MTDIVKQGRLYIQAEAPDYYEKTVVWKMADEIERLRTENQELKLQYLSDQGQWIEETGRLREVLRGIACTDDTCECGYGEHDGPFCELGRARSALGEKE